MIRLTRAIRYTAIEFTRSSKSTGILLILCTVFSISMTNLSFGSSYAAFWEHTWSFFASIHLPSNLLEWINDGLMALFFLVAGMEIKRELVEGELKSLQSAILPLFAAIGGVALPAIVYIFFNKGTDYAHGWGIPTATDIAFSIGIISMLGRKYVPNGLKVFLTALAIIDDLIAILIVAFFYGGSISWLWLSGAILMALFLFFLFKKKTSITLFHIVLGVLLWYCMHRSGIHATMAGVIFGFLVPVSTMERMDKALHLPVNFFIIPLFALANTCIFFNVPSADLFGHGLFWGVALGLFLGKVGGISFISYLLIKAKWATLPSQTNWYQFIGAGILAGIGFTMSIFITSLAFNDLEWQNISKIAILVGSALSMIVGYFWLKLQKIKVVKNHPDK